MGPKAAPYDSDDDALACYATANRLKLTVTLQHSGRERGPTSCCRPRLVLGAGWVSFTMSDAGMVLPGVVGGLSRAVRRLDPSSRRLKAHPSGSACAVAPAPLSRRAGQTRESTSISRPCCSSSRRTQVRLEALSLAQLCRQASTSSDRSRPSVLVTHGSACLMLGSFPGALRYGAGRRVLDISRLSCQSVSRCAKKHCGAVLACGKPTYCNVRGRLRPACWLGLWRARPRRWRGVGRAQTTGSGVPWDDTEPCSRRRADAISPKQPSAPALDEVHRKLTHAHERLPLLGGTCAGSAGSVVRPRPGFGLSWTDQLLTGSTLFDIAGGHDDVLAPASHR